MFDNTLDWLVTNRVETVTAHILTPYPGTRLFARLQAEGRILDYDWSHYNTSNVVFRPKHMTAQQLREGYLGVYRRSYSLASIFRRQPEHPRQRRGVPSRLPL